MYLLVTSFVVLLLVYAHRTAVRAVINSEPTSYKTRQASYDEYPFMVSIGKKGSALISFSNRQGHFCGGALITRKHVLTAAHCLIGEKPKHLRVIVGMTNFRETNVTYDVKKWKTYNKWAKKPDTENDHDIAVIKLTKSVVELYVQTIGLYPKNFNNETLELETAGWGETETCGTSPVLLKADLRLIPRGICETDLEMETNSLHSIAMQRMCTRSTHKIRLGCGDSGGPLILREGGVPFVVGVNEAYCDKSIIFINTHTRVRYYKKFISDATNSRFSWLFKDNK